MLVEVASKEEVFIDIGHLLRNEDILNKIKERLANGETAKGKPNIH